MHEACDENDAIIQKVIDETNEKNVKEGFFGRISSWNNQTFVGIALFAALITGASMPVCGGLILSPLLTHLSVPLEYYPILFKGADMKTEVNIYCIWMTVFAVVACISLFTQKYFFLRSSEIVTHKMRSVLYDSIISKNIGWFDLRENSVGILSTAMASDTSLVNGVSSEGLGP
jgi:ABC-type multidrug transport system fused ATPase/permease subunit